MVADRSITARYRFIKNASLVTTVTVLLARESSPDAAQRLARETGVSKVCDTRTKTCLKLMREPSFSPTTDSTLRS